MTVMEFRTGGPPRRPRGPGVLAGLRGRLGRSPVPRGAEPHDGPGVRPAGGPRPGPRVR
jgi:hypothetical protein